MSTIELHPLIDNLPNPEIIPKPGKVGGMIWIGKPFQILLMSGFISYRPFTQFGRSNTCPRRNQILFQKTKSLSTGG
jgi:hypothetical protein